MIKLFFNVTVVEENVDDDVEVEPPRLVSHSETEATLSKCIDWFYVQEEANATQVLLLRKIRNTAAQKAHASKKKKKKQKKMTDCFV